MINPLNIRWLTTSRIRLHLVLLTHVFAVSSVRLSAQIYTTTTLDARAIYRTDLDGSNPSTLDLDALVGGDFISPQGVIVLENQLFWTDAEHDAIYTINLDGTSFRKLVDLDSSFGADDYSPLGLAQAGGSIFWTDTRKGIYTAGIDGRSPRLLIDFPATFGFGRSFSYGIAATSNQLFWTNWSTGNEGIYTANLNGSNARKLVNASFPRDITATSTHIFWADDLRQAIYTARLDGSNRRILIDLKAVFGEEEAEPRGIAVSGSLLYWSEFQTKGIFVARLDGSNPEKLFSLPSYARFLAVRSPSTPPRPFVITDLRIAPNSPPFQRTWRLTWNSSIAESYRVLLSEDLKTWFPAGGGPWPSEGLQTEADITLPENLRRAYFRIERQ